MRFTAFAVLIASLSLVFSANSFAERGILHIITTPHDAAIYVDKKRRGNSSQKNAAPFKIKLSSGEYNIVTIKERDETTQYFAEKSLVIVTDDTEQTIFLKLKKRPIVIMQLLEPLAKDIPISEMQLIPAGKFLRSCFAPNRCTAKDAGGNAVQLNSFEIGKTEITFEQWDACVAAGGCLHKADDMGWGRGNRPVISVSWHDTQEYINWLNQHTLGGYRLPSEIEWEYAASAKSSTAYHWGKKIGRNLANCDGCGSQWDNLKTAPVAQFLPNKFGLYDVHGNVKEWTQDCWRDSSITPAAMQTDNADDYCKLRSSKGGSWLHFGKNITLDKRFKNSPDYRNYYTGFRIAR